MPAIGYAYCFSAYSSRAVVVSRTNAAAFGSDVLESVCLELTLLVAAAVHYWLQLILPDAVIECERVDGRDTR